MSRKKVDPRIRILLENSAKAGHRSLLVMIGDRGKEQIANLHYMLTKAAVAKRPTVLWCFKRELEFSSNRKKRMKQLKKSAKGLKKEEQAEDNPFELFLTSTSITYCYYHETDRILGNTFGMCVLQDFEALTPNLLARTIETVQGGGLIVILLKTLSSLKQLYTMAMDVHARYRTESVQNEPVARFNERFLLSLPSCPNCLVVDDELDVLPITGQAARDMTPLESIPESRSQALESLKMKALRERPDSTAAKLVGCAKTVDQAKAIEILSNALSAQPLRMTLSLTAGRGRGKSAALGLSLAAAVMAGYANMFITAPTPENLSTVFEFLFKGLDVLGFEEHLDYDVVQSTQPELAKCIVRVNIHRDKQQHRQTVLYISPEDAHLLGQAELVSIDEAAAIPLPLVRALTSGPQLVMMSSTVNGYEGTGRSLSLKLLAELRKPGSSRSLKELGLEEPIRYSPGDPVESWLNRLLCLEVGGLSDKSVVRVALPHPDSCHLYLINRDTLFSYHRASEAFLQRLIGLYVASHYKNSPNDIQLMSDAPGHLLFVLLGPTAESSNSGLPDILCFVQVCLEGRLSKQSVQESRSRGKRAAGDLIPWNVTQQFQDDDFGQLSGARIVRIAVNPEAQGMGYGTRTMALLERFFKGELLSVDSPIEHEEYRMDNDEMTQSKEVKPRANLRPLLTRADQVGPILLHWLGVSLGLTPELWRFYKRAGYLPVYLRQTTNDITGEHTIIVLKQLLETAGGITCSADWMKAFHQDWSRRFTSLLSYFFFGRLPVTVCLSLLEGYEAQPSDSTSYRPSPFDLRRLESYANGLLDHHMIIDLLPDISKQQFLSRPVNLSPVQSAILLALGLQRKGVEDVEKELNLPVSQVLAMFTKTVRKFVSFYRNERLSEIEESEKKDVNVVFTRNVEPAKSKNGTLMDLEDDLSDAADDVKRAFRRKQRELIQTLDMKEFEIDGDEQQWTTELSAKSGNLDKITVSIASKKDRSSDGQGLAKELYKKHIVDLKESRGKSKKLKH